MQQAAGVGVLGYKYSMIRGSYSEKDYVYRVDRKVVLPSTFDERGKVPLPAIKDQGNAGSCTGESASWMHQLEEIRQGETNKVFSGLMAYYTGRVAEGTVKQDAGAEIRDVVMGMVNTGVAFETTWPYNVKKVTTKPSAAAYAEASKHKALKVESVPLINQTIQTRLYSGFGVNYGIQVYSSFESDAALKTGIIPMPKRGEQLLGGHALVLKYWTLIKGVLYYIGPNSWGTSVGDKGWIYIPAAYITNATLSSDFWTETLEA